MGVRAALVLFAVVAVGVVVVVLVTSGSNGLDLGFGCPQDDSAGSYAVREQVGGESLSPLRIRARRRALLPPVDGTVVVPDVDCRGHRRTRRLLRFRGVAPELAVGEPDGDEVAVNVARLLTLDAFPLRRVLYGDASLLDPWPRRCSRRRLRERLILLGPGGQSLLRARTTTRRPAAIEIRRDTVAQGRERFGLPDPRAGDRITVIGPRCPYRDRSRGIRYRANELRLPDD